MHNPKYLKNSDLDLRMKNLARQERELLAAVLETIREIDNRKLFVELGYPNLFSYLVEGVGYSAASAQRRIDGARLLNELPEISSKIETGEIKLTQVSVLQKAVREIKRTRGAKVTASEKSELLESLEGKTHQETERYVAQFFDLPVVTAARERVQADESVRLEVNPLKKTTQSFSARTKKLVIQKIKCCQYRDPKTKKQCGSRWFLQVDHQQSKWAGGTNKMQNADLLCARHNRAKYQNETHIRLI